MSLMSAGALASVLSFLIFVIMAALYVAPWLASRQRAEALTPLLWVHAFRYVALQIYSAQQFGFAVSDAARDQIAGGDVIAAILAVISILALHYRLRMAPVLVWLFVAEATLDLVNATIAALRQAKKLRRGRLEGPHFRRHLAIGYNAQAGHHRLFVNVKTATTSMQQLHLPSPLPRCVVGVGSRISRTLERVLRGRRWPVATV
jgi:hypothetical protein